jgi:serralysin
MTLPTRSGRFTGAALLCVAALGLASEALAQGQSEAHRPQSPGRSGERMRPDNPRHANGSLTPELAIPASGDYRIDALVSGSLWSSSTISYSFYEDSVFGGTYYGSEAVSEVSEPVKTNVRAIMAWYGTMMNRTFVEVAETNTSTYGQIRFMRSTAPSYAYAYYPSGSSLGGDVHLNPNYDRLGDTNGFQHPAGEHGYTTLIHEIGHAIGLKHPHDGSPNLPSAEDNHTNTVMSYGFPGQSPGTPMGYDVMALQYIYGSRSHRTSNDTYQFTVASIDQYNLGGQLSISPMWCSTPTACTKQVIWDSGGYNALDLSGFAASTSGYRLDLRPLGWLSTNANFQTTYLHAGTVIGPGVSIRHLINSGSSDTIYANTSANVFAGYASNRVTGTDIIHNASSQDTLDLSGYDPGQVFPSPSGNDLLLSFGTNGSVRLVGYYLGSGNQPAITYGTVTPAVSIGDATVTEANTNTTASFVVTLTVPASTTQSVSFATTNGDAAAGSDYVAASGVVTFLAGETQKSISITIVGDNLEEVTETFVVTLSAPSAGLVLGDAVGVGTILNDDLAPNQLPNAVISATPTSGVGPLTVNFNGSGSNDPDGSIVSYAWSFGDGGTSTAQNPTRTYSTPGTYVAMLTVTDNRGGTDSETVSIVVTQNPALVMHVGSITMSLLTASSGTSARATVRILNASGQPVSGARVSGNWTGLVKSSSSAVTDANGNAVLTSRASKKKGTFTITVSGVTRSGSTYNPSANVETTKSIVVP